MVRPRLLKNKPLVEAILEVRWELEAGHAPEMKRDPYYKFLLGKLFESVKKEYPHHEELPAAVAPEEFTPYVVHHRFRAAPSGWPLLQVGPGVFTVNETEAYEWEKFERWINEAIPKLVAAHPQPEALKFNTLMLRFVNAISFDFAKVNALKFLSEKMGMNFSLPASIFEDGIVGSSPMEISNQLVFSCTKPKGVLLFKFNSGKKHESPALIFQIWLASRGGQVPAMPDGFGEWASAAHAIIERSFFQLIAGDLEKEFGGDA